ncbi:MAG: hypothetical protein DRH08_02740 [Deltaproteobacteria bacterium]|nr:MAG: hypothetical protein DRH08_02740 [Deltaproteobacteria bacterium]
MQKISIDQQGTYNARIFSQNRPRKQGTDKGKIRIEIEILKYQYLGTGKNQRERILIDTMQWVDPQHWNNKSEKLSKKEENFVVKNNKINRTFAQVFGFISSKGQQEIDQTEIEEVDFNKLRALFPSRRENRKTFADWIELYYNDKKDARRPYGTVKEFKTAMNRVKAFDKFRGKVTRLEHINLLWSKEINKWMINDADNPKRKDGKGYGEGTIHKTYVIIKEVLNDLWKNREDYNIPELTDKYQAKDFIKGKRSRNKPNAMTFEQREILYRQPFKTPYLEKCRKMMCLQAFTGIRWADIKRIRPENIVDDFLIFTPQKTAHHNVEVVQPLNKESRALLIEVDFNTSVYDTSNQKYNDYILIVIEKLREKFPDAKFREKYTSHNFRDTFISLAVQKGVNFKSILIWVGQSSFAVMDRYIELTNDFNRLEMNRLESKRTIHDIMESKNDTEDIPGVEDVSHLFPDIEFSEEKMKEMNKFKDPI